MAQTQAQGRARRAGKTLMLGVLAEVQCYAGGLAIAVGGYLRPGRSGQGADNTAKAADAATYRAVGIFKHSALGGATDGAVTTELENDGWYCLKIGMDGDALTAADIGSVVYIIDDETVGKTNPNSVRARAGILRDVTAEGAWVEIGYA